MDAVLIKMTSGPIFVAPGRLEIREGGGCLALFGTPFLASGIFMMLASLGVVTMHSDGQPATKATLLGLSALFTLVGALLVFGRSITVIDVGQYLVTKQWRVLLPVHTWTYQLSDYTAVTLAFVRGDSDTADRYPVGLKGDAVAPLPLCSPTQYAEARRCATAVAQQLGFEIEDTSTDHASHMTATEADAPLRDRLRATPPAPEPARPSVMTSEISEAGDGVHITVPKAPMNPVVMVGGFVPAFIATAMLAWLGLFSGSRALTPPEWIFFGGLFVMFGVVPAVSGIARWIRSRVGRTIVTVSSHGLRVQERGIFRTRTVASCQASEILDVDFSTKESLLRISSSASAAGPRTEWAFTVLSRFLKGKGIIVKTTTGLTTFGEGLADKEIEYLYSIVRRALVDSAG